MNKITFSVAALFLLTATVGAADGVSGAYLAGRAAGNANDFQYATTYNQQLLASEPANMVALESLLLSNIGRGGMAQAVEIANQISNSGSEWQIADLVILADDFAQGRYQAILDRYDDGKTINPLVDQLAKAWALGGIGDRKAALTAFDTFAAEAAFQDFAHFQTGTMFAAQQDWENARKSLEQVDPRQPTIGERARILQTVILAETGNFDAALAYWDANVPQPWNFELKSLHAELSAGRVPPNILPNTYSQGSSEIFLSIASFVAADIDPIFTLAYARMAQFINPDQDLARLIGADMLFELQQLELAVSEFAKISPKSPRYYSAELGRYEALAAQQDLAAGPEVLQNLIRMFPDEPFAYSALADAYRRSEAYEKALPIYDQAIEIYKSLGVDQWRLYYVRGITYERLDRWPEAETNFRKALELNPDQPQVLNYLGYSLIDKGRDLTAALAMIERAIEQSPTSGYIVDSMAWGLFRLGRYDEAVPYMEQAAELMPVDPIVNDHLGDVYWAVGRQLEARFQWRRALSFDPEPVEAERIRLKLAVGLDMVLQQEGQPPIHKTAQQ